MKKKPKAKIYVVWSEDGEGYLFSSKTGAKAFEKEVSGKTYSYELKK